MINEDTLNEQGINLHHLFGSTMIQMNVWIDNQSDAIRAAGKISEAIKEVKWEKKEVKKSRPCPPRDNSRSYLLLDTRDAMIAYDIKVNRVMGSTIEQQTIWSTQRVDEYLIHNT